MIRQIFDNVLLSDEAYNNLAFLCEYAPGRLVGSEESLIALEYLKSYCEELGADTVFLQEFKTPAWKCNYTGVSILSANGEIILRGDALGPSPSTPLEGLVTGVVEVNGLEDLNNFNKEEIEGKIVFFNKPVDMTHINTFRIYGSAVGQRHRGPAKAAELGAAAVLVRSVGTRIDTFPHTGSTRFEDKKIPCAAISTIDANILSEVLSKNKNLKVKIIIDAEYMEEITSYNLIADIRGNENPDEYIFIIGRKV